MAQNERACPAPSALPAAPKTPGRTTAERREEFEVVIVGGGPVGLAAGNLLAARGHQVLLCERNAETSDQAKAISLDDESLRILHSCGLAAEVMKIVVPGLGTRYYDRHGQPLFLAGASRPYRLGYPFKNPFSQPELEALLYSALRREPVADVWFGTEVVGLQQAADSVLVQLRSAGPGGQASVRARWVLGCDGGRSTVRSLMGITMTGRSFDDVWLVMDTTGDKHDEQYGMHHGRPRRPHVIVPGRGGRCRYEYRLRPDEVPAGRQPDLALMQALVSGYRELRPEEVERATTYAFHALIADRWSAGRCFLLGDAAHMMPPFAGQGLNSGLRDAGNLCWKLSGVMSGRLAAPVLRSYEQERRAHVERTTALSVWLGRIVMTPKPAAAAVRDWAIRAALRFAPTRRYLTAMRYRPSPRLSGGMVAVPARTPARYRRLAGTALPQPLVHDLDGARVVRLDTVLGNGWALLGVDLPAGAWPSLLAHRVTAELGAVPVAVHLNGHLARPAAAVASITDADGALLEAAGAAKGGWLLVRPDRVIAAAGAAADHAGLDAACPWLAGPASVRGSGARLQPRAAAAVGGADPVAASVPATGPEQS